MLGAVAALAVTLGLLVLALPLLRRLDGTVRGGRGVPLAVVQRIATGPKQAVALLRVGDRVLVVSLAQAGATLLTELTGETLARALAESGASAERREALPIPAAGEAKGGLGELARMRWPAWPLRLARPWFARLLPLALLVVAPALTGVRLVAQSPGQTPAPAGPIRNGAAPAAGPTAAPAAGVPTGSSSTAPAPASRIVPISPTSPAPARQALPPQPTPAGPRPPAINGPDLPKIDFQIGQGSEQVHLSGTVGLVVFMGALTLLPAMFLLMTSFTRILIVLHFLRSAIGTQTTPPGQLLVALAVLLTGVVMHPIIERANGEAFRPYMDGQLSQTEAYTKGLVPFREFMLANTRDQDVAAFAEMSGAADADSVEALPTVTIVAAFVTSELRTAFQMGFVIFLPFVVVDLIVASVLMSMGMFMLPPAMVSLPFKLLLFVLADGWTLVVKNLLGSFHGVPA
jgi:flagellar biosynthetic protein FliP